jgi:hypothetical protein
MSAAVEHNAQKADIVGSRFLQRKLIVAPYFAGRKSLM